MIWHPILPLNPPGIYGGVQRCPVCEGRGCVPWDPALPLASANTSSGPWRCPTCQGARVLGDWGSVPTFHVPPPGTYPNDPPPKT